MKLLHFSNTKIEKVEIRYRNAFYCFEYENVDEEDMHTGFYYGKIINVIETKENVNILDMTNEEVIVSFLNNSELEAILKKDCEDLGLEFNEEGLLDLFNKEWYDMPIEEALNKWASENGYDIIKYLDNSDGYEHDSYAIVNLECLA